jgi:hypothetical protein
MTVNGLLKSIMYREGSLLIASAGSSARYSSRGSAKQSKQMATARIIEPSYLKYYIHNSE